LRLPDLLVYGLYSPTNRAAIVGDRDGAANTKEWVPCLERRSRTR
jgi:hypothetical protein